MKTTDPEEIQALIKRGEFVIKEIEALYSLKKYRTLKKNYYDKNEDFVNIKNEDYNKDKPKN